MLSKASAGKGCPRGVLIPWMLGIQQCIKGDGRTHQRLITLQRASVAIEPSSRFRRHTWLRNLLIHQRQLSLLGNQGQQEIVQTLATGL